MVWVAVGLVWCENLYGDQGAQCSDKGYKNRPPTGNIELRQNEPAYSREHSATPHKRPTAKKNKKKFFQKKPPDAGANGHTTRTSVANRPTAGEGAPCSNEHDATQHRRPTIQKKIQDPPGGGGALCSDERMYRKRPAVCRCESRVSSGHPTLHPGMPRDGRGFKRSLKNAKNLEIQKSRKSRKSGNLARQTMRRPENVGHTGAGARQPTVAEPPAPASPGGGGRKSSSENFLKILKNLVFLAENSGIKPAMKTKV